jgi:hypothetical protein
LKGSFQKPGKELVAGPTILELTQKREIVYDPVSQSGETFKHKGL